MRLRRFSKGRGPLSLQELEGKLGRMERVPIWDQSIRTVFVRARNIWIGMGAWRIRFLVCSMGRPGVRGVKRTDQWLSKPAKHCGMEYRMRTRVPKANGPGGGILRNTCQVTERTLGAGAVRAI